MSALPPSIPAYYEVMFGWLDPDRARDPSPSGARAFGILEETIRQGQQSGDVRAGGSVSLARMVWAQVHGIGMLRLAPDLSANSASTHFVEFCCEILLAGLGQSR